MHFLKQSQTAEPLVFLMVDSTDHVTGKTGLSPTVTLSKNGAAFASPAGAVTEIGSGWYKTAGNATDTGTLGPLLLHATGTAADPVDVRYQVVAFDPEDAVRFGLTALPNAAAAATGGLPTVDASNAVKVQSGTGANQISLSSGLVTLAGVTHTGAVIPTVTTVGTLTTYTGNTPQTGDAYAIVNDSTFGNSKLVRSTTPANTLDVSATGEAGLDFNNVKDATGAHTLTNIRIPNVTLADTLTTYTGDTPQTGDAYARIGATGSGLTSLAPSSTALSNATWTNAKAVFLDAAITSRMATFTLPTNFADLAITATTGRVTAGTVSDKTGYSLSASGNTDIWDALRLGHIATGTFGEALGVFMSMVEFSTDHYRYLTNALEQAPTAGGLNAAGVRAAIGMASANLDTQLGAIDDFIDTEVSAIKAKTDNLPSDPADASDIAASFATVNSTLSTLAGYVDTEVAAVKTVTDKLATMLEVDGSNFRYTVDSLFNAPAGGGGGSGDWTTTEKGQIRYRLGLDGTQVEPTFELDPYVQVDLRQYLGVDCPATPIPGAPLVALSDGTGAGQISLDAGSVVQVNNVGTTATLTDRTGFALAADGLDSIAITAPDGVAETFREMLVQTWRRFFGKTTMSATQIKTFADDGTTVLTTQAVSDDSVVQTQGPAT